MSSYTSELSVTHLDGVKWRVNRPFIYHVTSKRSNEFIRVPKGRITDFASIPKIAWMIVGPPTGKHGKAAVIHDELYTIQIYSRKRSDEIFYEAMGVSKVTWWKKKIMYRAVRWFGGRAWKKSFRKTLK